MLSREFLKRVELFQELDEDQLDMILNNSSIRSFSPGETIFNQGEKADYLYVLIEGSIDLSVKSKEDIGFMTSKIDKEGSIFGTPSLMEYPYYNVTATSIRYTKALAVEARYLRKIIDENPEIGIKIMKRLSTIYFNRLNELRSGILSLFKTFKPKIQ